MTVKHDDLSFSSSFLASLRLKHFLKPLEGKISISPAVGGHGETGTMSTQADIEVSRLTMRWKHCP